MKINRISKKDDSNVVIHLDNDERLFLSYEVMLKNGLKKNDEIPENLIRALIKENQLYHIKQRAFRYLARRHHSAFELKIKLRQKGYDQSLISSVVEELIEKKIVDDHNYANLLADENIRRKLWGKNKLKAELIKRGVNKAIIDEVISEKFPSGNDIEPAVMLAGKKKKQISFKKLEKRKVEEKIFSYLFSKGYDYETSAKAVKSVMGDDVNEP